MKKLRSFKATKAKAMKKPIYMRAIGRGLHLLVKLIIVWKMRNSIAKEQTKSIGNYFRGNENENRIQSF